MATDKHGNVTNFSAEHFQKLLLQQQSQMEAQMKLIESLTQCLNVQSNGAATRDTQAVSLDLLTNSITEFHYDADSESTFEAWFKRWEDMFQTDFSRQDDSWKVRLLLRKLGTNEHTRFLDHILPKEPKDITFNEAVATLKEIFGESTSLFSIRYQCLKIVKRDTDDYGALADMVNRECERFKLRCLTDDQFKCLIFVSALQSPRDAEIRTRLLAKLDQDPDLTLKSLVGECKRLITLKHDTAMIEQSCPTIADTVHAVQKARKPGSNKAFNRKPNKPPTPCWSCGEWHFARYCPFKRHICDKCHKRGHKEDFCHQSRPRNVKQSYRRKNFRKPDAESLSVIATFHSDSKTRRRFITVLINGIPTRLQFDTASDITIISKNTWKHIKKPKMIDSNKIAHNASGGVLKLVGEINCKIAFNGVEKVGTCYLSDRPNLNLLGLDWMEKLQLFDAPMSQICNTVQTDPVHSSSSTEEMTRKLEQLAKSCGNCATASRAPPKTELRSWPKPTKPWSRVHVDFAGPINGQNFLIVVDAYSKWPEVFLMRSTKTSATVSRLRQIFSRFGCPETLVTDNGAQFTSATFTEFCQRCAIKHVRSPPFHPQSNGQAERFVDTFKRALLKSRREGDIEEVIDRFLFLYRSTQNLQTPGGISPAEAMMKRKLRMPYDAVRPSSESIAGERNLKMERDFNRRFGAKQRSFRPGQPVLVRDYRGGHAKWTPGTIQCKRGSVIYDVLVGTQVWVRHANQLRTTMCQPQATESAKLPFDLLTDSFNLPREPVEEPCHQTNSTRPQSTEFESRTLQPRRCTGRRRIHSRRLQVNPRLASYTTAAASGGEVSGNQIKT
ncbi:unnamed protein product [Dicrocoelium dendriticum]|nr:unnamed protein product [Dicrocoelium dendriticum]